MEEEVLGKAYDGRLMRRLLGYMRPYRMLVAISLAFLAVQSLLQGIGPLLTKIAVDKYLEPAGKPTILDAWLPSGAADGLARIALLYLAVLAGNFVTEFAQTYIMQYTGQLAMFDLRKQLDGAFADAGSRLLRSQSRWAAWSRASPPMSMR